MSVSNYTLEHEEPEVESGREPGLQPDPNRISWAGTSNVCPNYGRFGMKFQWVDTLLEAMCSEGDLRQNFTIVHVVCPTFAVGLGKDNYHEKCA